mmetsp:Transcript_5186/g.10552  ORF Transcript_5186/g.10552 Transcript_5186/m.10552 type:complete len:176 (-) Transcript_5186:1491-2018(-)|eukprot:CAMPEP_0184688956 /NCGR_PEP_ID=MMETSP0312-20130426/30382_1 /TAXON_ID=31354 /ORGANISM="Compsopogon coeruleus, Strain SAG 36.94" /LENGTH=175 /DNA_ID=CAMNT_0027146239 /DNA_START=774 /DNA_END=1301 /DNA_ORIENTATION=-
MKTEEDTEALSDAEALRDAARAGDLDEVLALLNRGSAADGVDVDSPQPESGNTALHYAAANGLDNVVDALLKAGARANVTNANGNTPLHWAALSGHMAVARLLIERGAANPVVVNGFDRTPVDEALAHGHVDIQKFLHTAMEVAAETSTRDFESTLAEISDSAGEDHDSAIKSVM